MLRDIPNRDRWMKIAERVLGRDLTELDSKDSLVRSQSVQLCLLIKGVSYSESLINEGVLPDINCGLSIGAYAAAVASGSLRFEDALQLVNLRGSLMDRACPSGYGMTAIMGLRLNTVESICASIKELYVANYNAETQIVVAGSEAAMKKAVEVAYAIGAEKCVRLRVSVPSHCPLMEGIVPELEERMKTIILSRPKRAYLSATTGRLIWDPKLIASDLVHNMACRTQWHEAVACACERGVRLAIEVPPGSVLTRLIRLFSSEVRAVSLAETSISDVGYLFRGLS